MAVAHSLSLLRLLQGCHCCCRFLHNLLHSVSVVLMICQLIPGSVCVSQCFNSFLSLLHHDFDLLTLSHPHQCWFCDLEINLLNRMNNMYFDGIYSSSRNLICTVKVKILTVLCVWGNSSPTTLCSVTFGARQDKEILSDIKTLFHPTVWFM